MIKKIIAAALALAIAMLSGCMNETSESEIIDSEYPGYVYVYADPGTGVEYLIWKCGYAGGIIPRFTSDGNVKVVDD